jgi:hypothetical protein
MPTQCRVCGSEEIISNARVMDYDDETGDHDMRILVCGDVDLPAAANRVYAVLKVQICGECGHAEFRVDNPHEVWDKYQASLS